MKKSIDAVNEAEKIVEAYLKSIVGEETPQRDSFKWGIPVGVSIFGAIILGIFFVVMR